MGWQCAIVSIAYLAWMIVPAKYAIDTMAHCQPIAHNQPIKLT
jgi:hypothetical protein